MRNNFGFLVLLAMTACAERTPEQQANAPLTDEHRTALADSVAVFAGDVITAISGKQVDKFMAAHVDSPELTYAAAGRLYPHKDSLHNDLRTYFASPAAEHVQFGLDEPKVNVIDANTAVVTARINSMNKDSAGNTTRAHQAWSIVTVRRNGAWKILQAHESYPRTPAAGADTTG